MSLRFVWWGNEDRATATKKAVALFHTKNPTITVTTEYSPYDSYYSKLATQVAGGSGPDLIQLDRPNLSEYQGRGVLRDLSQDVGNTLRTSGIDASLLAAGKINGTQCAIPGGQLTQMLVYDSALWQKAGVVPTADGWTWAEFSTAAVKVAKASGGKRAGTTDFGWAVDWFEVYLRQQGKSLYTTAGKLGFAQADLVAFWNFTQSLVASGAASKAEATTKMDGSTANSALVTGASASEINYDSNLTGYLSAYSGSLAGAPIPTDTNISGMGALASVSFAVSSRSKHQSAAVKLLDFLVNDADAGKILGATRGLPPNTSVRALVAAATTTSDEKVFEYETSVKSLIGTAPGAWPKGSAAIKRDFQEVYDDVIFKKTTVTAGAARLIKNSEQTLSSSS